MRRGRCSTPPAFPAMPEDSFKEFVLDQLGALSELRAKARFVGAHGEPTRGKIQTGKTEVATGIDRVGKN